MASSPSQVHTAGQGWFKPALPDCKGLGAVPHCQGGLRAPCGHSGSWGPGGWASHTTPTPPAHGPGPGWQYLLAAAAGPADVAEELEGLPGGHAGSSRGGRGGVAGTWPGWEGHSAKGPAVTALQDGDLQGAPGAAHLHQEQEQSYCTLGAHGGPAPVLNTLEHCVTRPSPRPPLQMGELGSQL